MHETRENVFITDAAIKAKTALDFYDKLMETRNAKSQSGLDRLLKKIKKKEDAAKADQAAILGADESWERALGKKIK